MGVRVRKNRGTVSSNPLSLPLDPPPFFLDDEILLPSRGLALYALLVGLLILIALRLLFLVTYPLPSLGRLVIFSIGTGGFYHSVRFLGYWVAWVGVTRTYPSSGAIHPAARGELPRNVFLLVIILPCAIFVPVVAAYSLMGPGFTPEMWLVVAVVISLSIRDVSGAWNLLFCDRETWIKESGRGLDVLRLARATGDRARA